jgi:signal peptidase II
LSRKTLALLGVFAVTIAVDQLTKAYVYTQISPGGAASIDVIPHLFSIVHAQNPGAVAGILKGKTWLFLGFTVVALYLVWSMWKRVEAGEWQLPSILGLILGGALGNAIDRIHKGTVTDFLRVYSDYPPLVAKIQAVFGEWAGRGGTVEWPTFNIADSALVIGVFAYIAYTWRYGEPKAPEPAKVEEEPPPGDQVVPPDQAPTPNPGPPPAEMAPDTNPVAAPIEG